MDSQGSETRHDCTEFRGRRSALRLAIFSSSCSAPVTTWHKLCGNRFLHREQGR